jgi:hypothetical protein
MQMKDDGWMGLCALSGLDEKRVKTFTGKSERHYLEERLRQKWKYAFKSFCIETTSENFYWIELRVGINGQLF